MNDAKVQQKIAVLKCPRFWRQSANSSNLRTNSLRGHVHYDTEWGYLYNEDCKICKNKNECKDNCKHQNLCKLYVIKNEEGIVKVKRINVNARPPVRGTEGAARYDWL